MQTTTSERTMPWAIYILSFGIFALITSELQVTGMLTVMAKDLGVSISQVGYLVSVYAGAMAIGGPVLTLLLLRLSPRIALLVLYGVFIVSQSLGAVADSYGLLMLARILTGATAGAFIGISLSISVRVVSAQLRGRAVAIVLAGIMLGTTIGLPLSSVIGEHYGWRPSFWSTSVLAIIGALATFYIIPRLPRPPSVKLAHELNAFKNANLWAVYSTSFCIIGATFAVFAYFVPILTTLSGFKPDTVSLLLFLYGVATLVGNHIVGKLANKHSMAVIFGGLVLLIALFAGLAFFPENQYITTLMVVGIGLTGVSMNPAMVNRVMQLPQGQGSLVSSVHTSVITLGLMAGTFISGFALSLGFSLHAPMWVGIGIALLGLLTLKLKNAVAAVIPAVVIEAVPETKTPCAAPGPGRGHAVCLD